jgi:lipid-A-disaccharide synthase
VKYYLIAGEASGDLHGSNLIRAIYRHDPGAVVRCWGGDRMQEAGGKLVKHYKEMSFMGFLEVLANLPKIFRNLSFCKKDIETFKPDALIFIDFSGFNLRIAEWAHKKGYRTHYYISPQVWASREGRVRKIKRDIDAMYVILPFEKDFYEKKHGMPVEFVGHPLIDALEARPDTDPQAFRKQNGLSPEKPIIALLPGSRPQEIATMLPVMLSLTPRYPQYQFVIAGAPSTPVEFYTPFLKDREAGLVINQTYPLLNSAHAALVTSGTATLETALLGVPQVVCYKGNWISYQIAKRLITLEYISLVNLIMDRQVVTELIQEDLNPENLAKELDSILSGPGREAQLSACSELREKLGGTGASDQAAQLIVDFSKRM